MISFTARLVFNFDKFFGCKFTSGMFLNRFYRIVENIQSFCDILFAQSCTQEPKLPSVGIWQHAVARQLHANCFIQLSIPFDVIAKLTRLFFKSLAKC